MASNPVCHSLKSWLGLREEKRARETPLQRLPANTPLVELESLVAFGKAETVEQHWNTGLVQHFHAGHVHPPRSGVVQIEGEEVQVIVHATRVPVVLRVAPDNQVPSSIEQRPGGDGNADAADVEVPDPGATFNKDALDPGQRALAGCRVGLLQVAFDQASGNPSTFSTTRRTGAAQAGPRGMSVARSSRITD